MGDPWQQKREVCLPKASPNETMKEPRAEWSEELKTRLCLQWVGRRRWSGLGKGQQLQLGAYFGRSGAD